VLGADPPRRISEQPYAGSFFRSQNATTWTPYQNEDLMFVINKAVFSGQGTVIFNLAEPPSYDKPVDRLVLKTDKLAFPTAELDFAVKGLFKSNTTYDTYNSIKSMQLFKYGDLLDASNKATSLNFLNTRQVVLGNSNSFFLQASLYSSDSDITPIFNTETVSLIVGEHVINNAGMSNTIISVVNRGNGYSSIVNTDVVYGSNNATLNTFASTFRTQYLAGNNLIGLYAANVSGGQGTNALAFAVANTTGNQQVDYVVIAQEGSGYIETPDIQIAAPYNPTNNIYAAVAVQGETSKRGGNIKAKYITRQITLEDGFDAGDMRVFMDVIRPTGTDVQVYYKVLGAADPDRFSDKSWVRMHKMVDRKSKDANELIELEFRPNVLENRLQYIENGIQYPIEGKFKYFAVKVCLLAADTTIVPMVKNLRIIATPAG
jgi:hypothetical protein